MTVCMMRESEIVALLATDVTLEEEKPHLIAWIEERRNQITKDLYSTYSKQYLEYTTLREF
jgi:hypothetical protein